MEFAEALKEMMDNWERMAAQVRAQFPDAGPEQVYQMTKAAMNQSLDL